MNILSLENITHSYTERKLFDEASFYLHEGEKVGIIGINGTGKSTLLKIMAVFTVKISSYFSIIILLLIFL